MDPNLLMVRAGRGCGPTLTYGESRGGGVDPTLLMVRAGRGVNPPFTLPCRWTCHGAIEVGLVIIILLLSY